MSADKMLLSEPSSIFHLFKWDLCLEVNAVGYLFISVFIMAQMLQCYLNENCLPTAWPAKFAKGSRTSQKCLRASKPRLDHYLILQVVSVRLKQFNKRSRERPKLHNFSLYFSHLTHRHTSSLSWSLYLIHLVQSCNQGSRYVLRSLYHFERERNDRS